MKDKLDEREVDIQYCPTEKMLSDILNKPKQGTPIKKDRVMLMNVPIKYNDQVEFHKTHPYLLPEADRIMYSVDHENRQIQDSQQKCVERHM